MKVVAVIMAGGKGERFWPRSRAERPKQFISLTPDGETMIQKTVSRLEALVEAEDIFVVTNKRYLGLVREQLPQLSEENVLCEPCARNTAPCIGLAAAVVQKKYGDAIMLVLPSDHLIKSNAMFIDSLRQAIDIAEEGRNLVTIGITPSYPETGYGYINFGKDAGTPNGVYNVRRFVEKPNLELAKEYVSTGEYLWNSGMFVWKASSVMYNLDKHLPDMTEGFAKLGDSFGTPQFAATLEAVFQTFRSESIDFGVMEKASDIFTIPGNFGWDDVGSWLAIERINPTNELGNVVQGDVITIGTSNSTIIGHKRLIAAVGMEDVVIVDTDDALLVCAKDNVQDIRKVIDNLKICNRTSQL